MSTVEFLKIQFMPDKVGPDLEKRMVGLDLIKVLSAFLVVFYHLSFSRMDLGFSPNSGEFYVPNVNRILMSFAACSVPLFFMINGALMFGRERSVKSTYLKVAKILVLVAIWYFLDFPYWFFMTLSILYAAFPVFQFIRNKCMKLYYSICLCVFIMPFLYNFVVMILYCMDIASLPRTGLFTMYSVLYFLLGPILLKKKTNVAMSICLAVFGMVLLLTECTCYTNIDQVMFDGVNGCFPTLGALLLSTGLFMMLKDVSFGLYCNKVISRLGAGVLYVYLMHILVMTIMNRVFGWFSVDIPLALLVTAVIFVVCVALGELLKRIPVLCFFVKM